MATVLCIDLDDGKTHDPRDYGCRDFDHDPEGNCSCAYFYHSKAPKRKVDISQFQNKREQQRWKETCSDMSLNELEWHRQHTNERNYGFQDYRYYAGGWDFDE